MKNKLLTQKSNRTLEILTRNQRKLSFSIVITVEFIPIEPVNPHKQLFNLKVRLSVARLEANEPLKNTRTK